MFSGRVFPPKNARGLRNDSRSRKWFKYIRLKFKVHFLTPGSPNTA